MLFTFLLVVQMIVAFLLVVVILVQRSEGGGLGVGSSSAGLMTARGAADFLTRATALLATLFVGLRIAFAAIASISRAPTTIDPNLSHKGPVVPTTPLQSGVPLAGGQSQSANPLSGPPPATTTTTPAPQSSNGSVPLQH